VGPFREISGTLRMEGRGECCVYSMFLSRERLSHMGTAYRKRTPDVRELAWKAYMSCWSGFPLQDVHRFESP
jgi:hypothetical protein